MQLKQKKVFALFSNSLETLTAEKFHKVYELSKNKIKFMTIAKIKTIAESCKVYMEKHSIDISDVASRGANFTISPWKVF